MKIIGLAAALALLAGAPVASLAQGEKPAPAKTATETKADMKQEAPMLKMGARTRGARADVDARECLKFPTNREIHICAEKYRR